MENNNIQSKSIDEIKNFIIKISDFNFHAEVCGFIGFSKKTKEYIAQVEKNQSADPKNYFIISPLNYLKFKKENEIIAIFHSHVFGDESLSEFDIKTSEVSCVPFLVFSINSRKFNFYEPQNKDYNLKIIEKFKKKI
jgi:proteasome lid subunit RPN8/RPN11